MSGHSKWSTIKHKKAAADAKKGKIFTKLIKEITLAAREGGGDPETNPRLRTAIANAKAQNMPNDNIERGILRGTGELPGLSYEEITYEGYGPQGVAVLVEVVTDNRNRSTADMRYIFSKNGGNMGEMGSVAWLFDKKGLIVVDKDKADEDEIIMIALESGAEDVTDNGDSYEITTQPEDFEVVREAIDEADIEISMAEISMIPQSTVEIDGKEAMQMLKLLESLEDYDDVQNVYANFDMPDEILDQVA
ncbi:YebC/PmpR family DNA-binding transcriptional regulator [Candidatus Poribacteria bacterium]|nr:YebC/PmpR family DNA-binding transcriptional regulator [Candidatus Poribacteria bacterium]